MKKLPEMPYRKKYQRAYRAVRAYQDQIPPYIAERLGGAAADTLIGVWGGMLVPVSETGPDEEKYKAAHSNWLWMSKCILDFIDEQLGEKGVEDFLQGEIKKLEQEFSELDILGARLLGVFAPGMASEMFADQVLYEMQWRVPVMLTSHSSSMVCATVDNCPIAELPGLEKVCQLGCHQVYARWVAEQKLAKIEFTRQENGCRITLTPPR
jgi:hypothetical protein